MALDNTGGVAKIIERLFLPYALWFFIGVFCYVKRNAMIPVLKRIFPIILLIYLAIRYSGINFPGYYCNVAIGIMCPLLVISCAYSFRVKRVSIDLTYGMFLYHWLVLNIIVHFDLFNRIPLVALIVFYVAITLICAYISSVYVGGLAKKMVEKALNSRSIAYGGR